MSNEQEPHTHFNPDELMETATAIADRGGELTLVLHQIIKELGGPTEELTPEILRAKNLGRTTLLLARVANPNLVVSSEEQIDATLSFGGYDRFRQDFIEHIENTGDEEDKRILEELRGEGDLFTDEQIKGFQVGMAKYAKERLGQTDEDSAQKFAQLFAAATEVAKERGVSLAEVYRSDELYYAACRKNKTIEQLGDEILEIIPALEPQSIEELYENVFTNLMPKEILQALVDEGEDVEAIKAELKAELLENEEANQMIKQLQNQAAEIGLEAARQLFVLFATKIYGRDAFSALPLEKQALLTPTHPLTSYVMDRLIDVE